MGKTYQNYIQKSKILNISAFLAGIFLFLNFATILFPIPTSPDSSLATTGTAVPSVTSLTLDSTSSSASVSLIVNDTNGTFAESTTSANFSVTTNNYTGYTLSISDDGSSTLVSSTSSDDTISSVTDVSGISSSTFDNASYNGYWGYKPSKYNSVSNSNYLPSPSVVNSSTHSVVLDTTSSANSTANSYTIGLAMRADFAMPAGTYTKTLNLAAVANPIIYSITYNKNTTDTVSNMPSNIVSESTDDTNIALQNLTPVRSGYTFQGWCLGTVSADGTTCTGTTFQPNGSYGIDQTGDNRNVNLIAMWKQDKIYIQDFTKAMCQEQASSGNVTVYDKRDDNDYTVRYINNNCWMTQNLRFSGSSIDSSTTNINATKTISWGDLASGNSYDAARYHNSGNTTNGYWYNYAGASAMTIIGSSNSSTQLYDICPAGWRLPSNYEISNMIYYKDAFVPVAGGWWFYNSRGQGWISDTSYGYWWASTVYNDDARQRYSMGYDGSKLFVQGFYREYGYYVRCIRSS